jgi:hypothetical protein
VAVDCPQRTLGHRLVGRALARGALRPASGNAGHACARKLSCRHTISCGAASTRLASDDRREDAPPARSEHIRDNRRELNVSLFEYGMNTLHTAHDLAHQFLAGACQVAKLLDRLRLHEVCADEALRQQIGGSRGIVHVALAAGHLLDMRRIGQGQLIPAIQNVPERLPVDARRLHRTVADLRSLVQVRKVYQPLCRGREPPYHLVGTFGADDPPTRHDLLVVHVLTCAPSMHRLDHHVLLGQKVAGVMSLRTYTLSSALQARRSSRTAKPSRQSKVRKGLQVKLTQGFVIPREERPPVGHTHYTCFIDQGVR